MTNDAPGEQRKIAGNPPNTEPPDIPPPTPGHPAVPDELPGRTPHEARTRGPNGPRTPNPATDVQGDDPSRGKI
jgi:hypothetical protein